MTEKIGLEAVLGMSNFNKGMGQYLTGIGKMEGRTGGLAGKMTGLGQSILGVGAKAGLAAAGGIAALGAGLVALTAIGVKTAADFESQMAILSVATGDADTSLQDLKDTALAVGADTALVGVSASEAAEAMTGLYKAGLDTNDILGDMQGYLAGTTELTGALRAAVDLQAASELDLAGASDIVAIAMATFGLAAEDATRISDNFVQAADASVAEVQGLADAMKNVGPTAAQFGWSLEDTNNALAILSTRGIQGSEAGTALKSMMTNLMRGTGKTKEALESLNIELYNADGTMRELPDILGQLESSMSGLTEEQRNSTIQTLAGTFGMKAMATLLDEGVVGWDAMAEATANAGTAQEIAAARTNTFEGAMEALDGVMETLKIQIGDAFLPILTELIRKFGDFVADKGPAIAAIFAKIAEWIGVNLPIAVEYLAGLWTNTLYPAIEQVASFIEANVIPVLQEIGVWLGEKLPIALAFVNEHWEAFRAALVAIGLVLAAIGIAATILAIVAAFTALLNPITLIIVAVGLLAAAWTEDWGGIQTFLTAFWKDTLEPFVDDVVQWFQTDLPEAIATMTAIWDTISTSVTTALDTAKTAVSTFVEEVKGFFQGLFDDLIGHSIITDLVGNILSLFAGLPGKILGALADLTLGPIIKALEKGLVGGINTVSKVFLDEIKKWQDETEAWMDQLVLITEETLPDLETMFETVSTYILEQLAEMIRVTDLWREAIEYITNTTLPALQTMFATVSAAIIAALTAMINKTNDWREALENVIDTLGDLKDDWMDAFDDMIGKVDDLIDKLVGAEGSLLAAMGSIRDEVPNMKDDFVDAIDDMGDAVGELIRKLQNAIAKAKYLASLPVIGGGGNVLPPGGGGPGPTPPPPGVVPDISRALPAYALPAFAGAGISNQTFNMSFDTTINNGMDQALFEGRVRQTVRDALRGD